MTDNGPAERQIWPLSTIGLVAPFLNKKPFQALRPLIGVVKKRGTEHLTI